MNKYLDYTDDFWTPIYLNINKIEPHTLWGSVLYLGMGSSLIPRLQSDKVTKTIIVEIDEGTIQYNKDNNLLQPEWVIYLDDVFTFKPLDSYDFIFIDIFYHSTTKSVMEGLIDRYKPYLNDGGKIFYLQSVVK
jgi:hypothetical protein